MTLKSDKLQCFGISTIIVVHLQGENDLVEIIQWCWFRAAAAVEQVLPGIHAIYNYYIKIIVIYETMGSGIIRL